MRKRRVVSVAFGLVALAATVAAAPFAAVAPPATQVQADPNLETFAYSSLDTDSSAAGVASKQATLKYHTQSWSAEAAKRLRQNAEQRHEMNKRWQVAMQTELKLPYAVSLNGRRLEPDVYRIWLVMNDAGALEFALLLGGDEVRIPADVSESRQNFPYLTMSLTPATEGFALVFQWGTEYGRVLFPRAR